MSEAELPVCAVGSKALCFASPGNYQRVDRKLNLFQKDTVKETRFWER